MTYWYIGVASVLLITTALLFRKIWRLRHNPHPLVGNYQQLNRHFTKKRQAAGTVLRRSSATDTTKIVSRRPDKDKERDWHS